MRASLGLLVGLCLSQWASAEPIDESFYLLLEKALDVNIAARVSESGEAAIWDVKSSEITIPGRSVQVKLVGSNIVVIAQLTPYLNEDNSILLVAQGQVWISSPVEDQIKYLTTLKSLPIKLGETVMFFPLGVSVQKELDNVYNIELEITIKPYTQNEK